MGQFEDHIAGMKFASQDIALDIAGELQRIGKDMGRYEMHLNLLRDSTRLHVAVADFFSDLMQLQHHTCRLLSSGPISK